jgi:hypothetical protein
LEAELLEQVQGRLVVWEDFHGQLVDLVVASPPDRSFDRSGADSVTSPCLGDTRADLGWLAVSPNRRQIADHVVHRQGDQHERPRCGEAVLQPPAAAPPKNRFEATAPKTSNAGNADTTKTAKETKFAKAMSATGTRASCRDAILSTLR